MSAIAERIDVGRARLAGMRGPSAWARLAALRYLQLQRESLATCDDLPSVARLVVEAALELMPNVDGAVYEMVDGDEVLLAACSGIVAGFSGTRMPLKDSLSGGVLFSGKAVICDPLQNSCPATAAACRRFDIASLILVPTIIDRRVRGVLKLASRRPFAFTHDDLVTGELIASSLCIAHHAEDARIERETSAILHRRLHAMFEQAAVGVAHVDLDGRLLRINDRFADIVGWDRSALEQFDFQNITHPDDLPGDVANLGRLRRGEIDRYTVEKRYIGGDGSIRWARLTVNLIEGARPDDNFFVSVLEDIAAQRQAQEDARIDQLTRLPNRAFVAEYLPQLLARSNGSKGSVGLAFVDLDGFKSVNDVHGHIVGDQCLIEVSRALRSTIGSHGMAARLSGDEFVLIFSDVSEHVFERCGCAVRSAIAELGVSKGWGITASLGSVFTNGSDGFDAATMMHLADARMYSAKRAGKARNEERETSRLCISSAGISGWF